MEINLHGRHRPRYSPREMNIHSTAEPTHFCPQCGHSMRPDDIECANCARLQGASKSSREWVLTISLALIVPAFAITGVLTRMYHVRQESLAAEWLQDGSRAMQAGNAAQAVAALRTSLAYTPDDPAAELRLADAEMVRGHYAEAQSYLDAVLTADSGNGAANLSRARLAVREQNIPDALRYYHNAFYGEWPENETNRPLQARLELSQFLLEHGKNADAEAELISLAAAAPPNDVDMHLRTGELFFRAGSARHALDEFHSVLQTSPDNVEALKGAGMASLQLGAFSDAERYLAQAGRVAPNNTFIQTLLAETRNVLEANPFVRGLSEDGKQRRAQAAFLTATARLNACAVALRGPLGSSAAGVPDLQTAYARVQAMTPLVTDARTRTHPAEITDVMDLVFDIEKITALKCGPPQGTNLALLRLSQAAHGPGQ